MDRTIIQYLINIIVLISVGSLLIVISIKLSKKSMDKINLGIYTQIIEKFNLNKDLSLYVIKTGLTGCVVITSVHNTKIIKKLDENEMNEIMIMKKKKQSSIDLSKISGIDFKDILNKKLIRKKDDRYIK